MKLTAFQALVGVAMIGALAAGAAAQTSHTTEAYEGIVNGTGVHVRARPGLTGYPCTKVSHPTKVTVVESKGGWLKILPVADTFSVVEKRMVRPDATTKTVTVIEDNVWIRAGGRLRSQDFWAIQLRVKRGTELQVIGQTPDFYKITPPPGAYFWISARYVTRATAKSAPEKPDVPSGRRITGATGPTEPEITLVETIKSPYAATELKDASAKFEALDRLLAAEFRKPAKERNLASFIDKYESLRSLKGGFLARYIDSRVQYIKAAIERTKDVGAVDDLIEQTLAKQKEYEDRRTTLTDSASTPAKRKHETAFAATGVLYQSDLFPGTGAVPKRYALRGKQTQKVIGYVQPASRDVDLSEYLGKEIGVTGARRFDSEIGLIIEVRQVTVLGESGGMPLPAAPTIIKHGPILAPRTRGPRPLPMTPKPEPEPEPRPLPLIEETPTPKKLPEPATEPAPKAAVPKLAPMAEPRPKAALKPAIKPRPRPAAAVAPLPRRKPGPSVDGVPLIVPRAKPERVAGPTTRPVVKPATKPAPKTRAATHPAPVGALPQTGLPVIDSGGSDSSPVIEEEYE